MNRLCSWLSLGALALLFVGLVSQPVSAAGQQTTPFSWDGFYAGLNVGYGWGGGDTTLTPFPTAEQCYNLATQQQGLDLRGVIGGLQAGYNLQKEILVFGVETDFSGTNMSGTRTISPIIQNDSTPFFPGQGSHILLHQDIEWMGTLRLRMGVTPVPRLLLYGTGGMAYGHVNYDAVTDFRSPGTIHYPISVNDNKLGITVGGGAEYAITNHLTVKTEYLYYNLGDEFVRADPVPVWPPFQVGYRWHATGNTVKIGVNFKF